MYFFKFSLMALVLAFVLSFTGCSKSDDGPVYKDGCFKYDDKTYNSLNAAIRAAMDNEDDEEDIIYLLDDVLDNEPLSINNDDYDVVTFNLGKFTYVSANGLDFKDVQLNLSGEGNFECKSGALSSESRIEVAEDFKGKISAPVILNDAVMAVFSPKATAAISQLKFIDDGVFTMEVVSEKPASVVIDKLTASDDSEVCAIDGGSVVIKEGGKVHVHNYKLVDDVPANCLNAGYKAYKCEDCGDDYVEFKEGEIGKCIAEELIHHAAVEPTDSTSGNIEYWECPDCGATYSDAEGKQSIYPIRFPESYNLPLDVLFGCDEALEQQNIDYKEIAKKGLGLLFKLIGSKYEVTNEQLLEEMKKLSAQIEQLSKDVAELRKAVDGLYKEVQNITLGRALSEYTSRIVLLQNTTLKYYQIYQEIMNTDLSLDDRNAQINKLFEGFQNELGAARLDAELLTLVQMYCENPTFEHVTYRNIPEAQEKFTQNIYLWESEGYLLRTSITVTDFQRLASSYFIINAYLNWTGLPQNKQQMANLKTNLDKCYNTMEADLKRIEDRDTKYRIYCGGKRGELVYYERPYFELGQSIQDWFEEGKGNIKKYYFPREDKDRNTFMASCEQILKDVGLADGFIEHSHLAATYEKYKGRIGNNTTGAVMEFIGFPAQMGGVKYYLTERTGEACYNYGHFGKENKDKAHPHYKIFYLEKSKGCSGLLRTSPVINMFFRPTSEIDWWWFRDNISMWATSGKITDPGNKRHYDYFTNRKVKNVK